MLSKLLLYFHTLKYLKPIQIRYRIYYALKKKLVAGSTNLTKQEHTRKEDFTLWNCIDKYTSYQVNQTFFFLNLEKKFISEIDWNYNKLGKLWTYNLCYFDFLNQQNVSKEEAIKLMSHFSKYYDSLKDAVEPYPSSLRLINWIKFLTYHQIDNEQLQQVIYSDLQKVNTQLEYHLMGNHLLENGFALLIGAIYFNDKKLIRKSEKLLIEQLDEQILADGAHFELSPMYHQILFDRLLDSINTLKNNPIDHADKLLNYLVQKAEKMLGWLIQITYANGDIPHFNDSTNGIAPSTNSLINYARELNILPSKILLKESGYRKYQTTCYEMVVDVGNIGPDYIPGHAHSDTLGFDLYIQGAPFIVDTAISTYEKGSVRDLERGTRAHNTVLVNNREQSKVWGGFRVAQRAKSNVFKETINYIKASHDGYKSIGVEHLREFTFSTKKITIEDTLNKNIRSTAYFHFHPDIDIVLENGQILGTFGAIQFSNFTVIKIENYNYSMAFNKRAQAKVAVVDFNQKLTTEITLL